MAPLFNRHRPHCSYRSGLMLCLVAALVFAFAVFTNYGQKRSLAIAEIKHISEDISVWNAEPTQKPKEHRTRQRNFVTDKNIELKPEERMTSPRTFAADKENAPKPQEQNTAIAPLQDATRHVILDRVAFDLGIAPSQRSMFPEYCPVLTPINFCAEFAREAHLEICSATDQCQDNSTTPNLPITKQAVEDSIRNGIGLLEIDSKTTGSKYFLENEMMFHPQTSQTLVSSLPPSTTNTGNGTPSLTHSKSATLLDPGSLNNKENTEMYAEFNPNTFFENGSPKPTTIAPSDRKIILWYSPTRYWPKTPGLLPLRGCPDYPCYVTTEKEWTKKSAAMIFASDVTPAWPPERRADQVFVFQNHEPPNKNFLEKLSPSWASAFNWTMTYRHDSDIVRPYGLVRRNHVDDTTGDDPLRFKDYKAILKNKTKLVAAMVSNCGASSRRDDYIRELSRHIQVDVYGKCGNYECPRDEDDKCFQEISHTYKFFLAFESSICEDYITEKFFRFFNMDLIIVARGSNQYYVHGPKETFINTADFPSPKQLAIDLDYLDRNPEEYLKRLQAKSLYTALFQDWAIFDQSGEIKYHHYANDVLPVCQICQRLWNLNSYAKVVPNIKSWVEMKMCKKKEEIDDIGYSVT